MTFDILSVPRCAIACLLWCPPMLGTQRMPRRRLRRNMATADAYSGNNDSGTFARESACGGASNACKCASDQNDGGSHKISPSRFAFVQTPVCFKNKILVILVPRSMVGVGIEDRLAVCPTASSIFGAL